MTARAGAAGGALAPAGRRPGRFVAGAIAGVDGLLDVVVVALALWTVVYHLWHGVAGWPVETALGAWLVAGAVVLVALGRDRAAPGGAAAPAGDVRIGRPVRVLAVAAVALVVAGVLGTVVAEPPGWWLAWLPAVGSLVAAAVLVVRARPVDRAPGGTGDGTVAVALVLLASIAFAVAASVTVRPDADDVLLVNRSVWVEERGGPFPVRDTLFSDEEFALTRPDVPSTAFEPLVGAIARVLPVGATTTTYLGVGPVVALLGVLALWRLLRELRAPVPALAAVAAAGFLALDGAVHPSFGNFGFVRSWQGKSVFLLIVVPLLWRHALGWGRDRDRRSLVGLVAAATAGVGLTTTAVFVTPPVVVLGAAAGFAGNRRTDLGPFAGGVGLGLLPPLLAGAAARLVGAQPVDVAAGLFGAVGFVGAAGRPLQAGAGAPPPLCGADPAGPWYCVLGSGWPMAVATAAVLLAWLATRDRAARVALIGAPLVVLGVFHAPGVLRSFATEAGIGAVAWRVMWILPVAAMVGLVATAPVLLPRGAVRVAARVVVPAGLALAVGLGGFPVWDARNGTAVGAPAWELDPDADAVAARLVELSDPGDLVVAPLDASGALAVRTTRVRAANPRNRYMTGRHVVPEFHAPARRFLTDAVAGGLDPARADEFATGIRVLDPATVCTRVALVGNPVEWELRAGGYTEVDRDEHCVYWRRVG